MKHALDHYILHQALMHESFPMSGEQLKVYVQLLASARDKTLETFVGTPTMAIYTGLDRRSVQRAFLSLERMGAIKRRGKVKETNNYRLIFPDSIPFHDDARYDAKGDAKGDARHDAKGDAKGDARVRHHESTFPQVNTYKANSEKEEEKEDEKELDPESVFLGLYGHIIDMALKKYLHLLPPELCSPAFTDTARKALTEKLRAQHSVSPLPLCIKGNYRSQQIAQQLADDFTAKEHPKSLATKSDDISTLLTQTIRKIPND
jgi:hypothetical protein